MKIGSTVNMIKIKKPCLERSHARILFCISSATSNGNSHNSCPIYVYTLFLPLLCIFSHLSPSLKRKYLLLLECVEVCTQGSTSWKCSSLFHGGKTSSSFIFSTDSRLYPLPVAFLDGKKATRYSDPIGSTYSHLRTQFYEFRAFDHKLLARLSRKYFAVRSVPVRS